MSDDVALRLRDVGKVYRVFESRSDRVLDALGIGRFLPQSRQPRAREFWALRGIDFELHPGERVGVIGRNGAGKTTICKLITGNLDPTEGSVGVHGEVRALLSVGAEFHPEFTGFENIRASLIYQGLSTKEIEVATEDIAEFTELGEFLGQPLWTYSAGMQARLAFASATVVQPEILVIDEILGAGDAYFIGKSTERMTALVEGGASVLLVSHSLDHVLRFCPTAIWVDRGRIVKKGPSLEVVRAYEEFMRRLENRRLQARNRRAADGGAQDAFEVLTVRLTVEGEDASCDVRRVDLLEEGEPIESVSVGDPQDEDGTYAAFVTGTESGWSSPQTAGDQSWRTIRSRDQPIAMAWAQFRLPAPIDTSGIDCAIEYRTSPGSLVSVDVLRDNEPLVSGSCEPSSDWRVSLLSLSVVAHLGSGSPEAELTKDGPVHWPGEGSLRIERGTIEGPNGGEQAMFEAGDPLALSLCIEARRPGPYPVIPVAVLYRMDGIQVLSSIGDEVELELEPGERCELTVRFDSLKLARGRYVFAAAIYRTLDHLGDSEYYDLVDRCYEFEVRDERPFRDGVFETPSTWTLR